MSTEEYIRFLEKENKELKAEAQKHEDDDWGFIVDMMEGLLKHNEKELTRLQNQNSRLEKDLVCCKQAEEKYRGLYYKAIGRSIDSK